jgi:putative acetyltransferase
MNCALNLFDIRLDDLRGPAIIALLQAHLRSMHLHSPPESVHALDLDALRQPDITFWSAWHREQLAGCGAIKQLDSAHGEIKSMRTAETFRRQGVAAALLQHILDQARKRAYKRVSLETGSMAAFAPARALYRRFGFNVCGPFANYSADPNSVFMQLDM